MAGRKSDFTLPKFDDIFSTQEMRDDEKLAKIRDIPLELIDDFPDHPYKVRDDEDMMQLAESIKERGVITPATVRQKEDGRYELISGHRRKRASELAGFETLRCEVVELDRDDATILMVESNLQRSVILPSEKAFAYKMRLDAMKRKAGRPSKDNSVPVAQNYEGKTSRELLAEQVGESQDQVRRFIRLTNLVPELLGFVDEGKMKMRPAVELTDYMFSVVAAAGIACREAAGNLETFQVRAARGARPRVGSERHTGAQPGGNLTVVQFRTESGRNLILYNFPCHPTVLNAANLLVSADFAGGVEPLLDADMAVFLNGAAGDISTRFTRRESSFGECRRMSEVTVEAVRELICKEPFVEPEPLKGIRTRITLQAKQVETEETARKQLEEAMERWQQGLQDGADAGTVRILKSYVEGAGVNLEFARTLSGIRQLHLPVTAFRFCGLDFISVPGELFSVLQPQNVSIIGYANGYYRYIGGEEAYEAGYYEAMAAIVARGEGEKLVSELLRLQQQLDKM